jgi:hypothetical protein
LTYSFKYLAIIVGIFYKKVFLKKMVKKAFSIAILYVGMFIAVLT